MSTTDPNIWSVSPAAIAALSPFASSPNAYLRPGPQIQDGLAIVTIEGVLSKSGIFWGDTSTAETREHIQDLARDSTVKAVLLHIDSPGGQTAGVSDLAQEVSMLAKRKRVHAYIEDSGTAGAYWIASQASYVSVNRTGIVGGLGTFMVVPDSSKQAEQRGIKVHVVRQGKYKGMGVPGTKFTDEMAAAVQENVNALNNVFISDVASGRRMSLPKVRELATGSLFIGEEARQLGLVDAVCSYDDAISHISKGINHGR